MEIDKSKKYYTLGSPTVPLKIERSTIFGNVELYFINQSWYNKESLSEKPIENIVDPNLNKLKIGSKVKLSVKNDKETRIFQIEGTIDYIIENPKQNGTYRKYAPDSIQIKVNGLGIISMTYAEYLSTSPQYEDVIETTKKLIEPHLYLKDNTKKTNFSIGGTIKKEFDPNIDNKMEVNILNFTINKRTAGLPAIGKVRKIEFKNNSVYIKFKKPITNYKEGLIFDEFGNTFLLEYKSNNQWILVGYKINYKRIKTPTEFLNTTMFGLTNSQKFDIIASNEINICNPDVNIFDDVIIRPYSKGYVVKISGVIATIKVNTSLNDNIQVLYKGYNLPISHIDKKGGYVYVYTDVIKLDLRNIVDIIILQKK